VVRPTACCTSERARPSSANACRHQTSVIAGTLFQGTKLPLTVWFLALYLVSQSNTGSSALTLKRELGVSYPTAWLLHHKLMQAMVERKADYLLCGPVQIDDAYLGGEFGGGTAGRGSENKVPFVAAVSLDEDGHPYATTPLCRSLPARRSPRGPVITSALPVWSFQMDWRASLVSPIPVMHIDLPSLAGANPRTCRSSSG